MMTAVHPTHNITKWSLITADMIKYIKGKLMEKSRVAPNFGFGFGKFEFGRIWQTPMQLQCVQLVT